METNKTAPVAPVVNAPISPRLVALAVARSYIGKEEVPRGSNWGAFVQATLAMVGIAFPASWCMAFVYRCYKEAAGAANPCYRTGGVLKCWQNSKSRILKKDATPANILPGYQFIYDHGKGQGHTGIVVSIDSKGIMTTIEGNTNPQLSSNGYGVFELNRRTLHDLQLVGFIAY